MKKALLILITACVLAACGNNSTPPKVISTVPANGDRSVDPSLSALSVTFSKPMMDKNWSWAYTSKDSFPEMNGQPRYVDGYTKNVLPVRLVPNKEYEVWINSSKFMGFKDRAGNPAKPYKLIFRTAAGADTKSTKAIEVETQNTQAVEAAKTWLALVDAGAYGQSWDNAADYFKGAINKTKWEQALKGVRTPLGAVVSRSLQSATYAASLPGAPDGKYVVIQFSTTFKNKASSTETITPMLGKDGRWQVAGYYIK